MKIELQIVLKILLKISLIILFPAFVIAQQNSGGLKSNLVQDRLVVLSTKMFDDNQAILLSPMNGWLFRSGNDPSWAGSSIDDDGWEKMNPIELSARFADKTGKAEGWFRLRFKLDSSFRDIPIGFRRGGWAATDIYIDGNLAASFGSTDTDGQGFREYNPIDKASVPSKITPGKEHLLAVHFLDYLSPIPPKQLKSEISAGGRQETAGLRYLIMFVGPKFDLFTSEISKVTLFYRSIWVTATFVLAVLFWLLVFQNAEEKRTLILIAIYSTFSALSNLTRFPITNTGISFPAFIANELLGRFSYWAALFAAGMIVGTVLRFNVPRIIRRLLIVYFVLATLFVSFDFFNSFVSFNTVAAFFVFMFALIVSRKKLTRAQWVITGGLMLSIFFVVLLVTVIPRGNYYLRLPIWSCYYFSFPLSLVVFVSLRFRQIIREVRENAHQVVQMTREREEEAVNQQKILKEEVSRQTFELRTTLDNLKATQSQLIQSEKMASLGELTAGIAHEIQNPLNFVNNFSEVNKELIEELNAERLKPTAERDEKSEGELLNDISQNLEKISHHGKRADAIVKGMLQHSRASSGQKEPTDINALADEYLRLAYHGLRAKDKSFNATFETDLDKSIGKVNVVPQDIGRVLLNLINNAFYAAPLPPEGGFPESDSIHIPKVWLSTKKNGRTILISVKDNGPGIPAKILDKIFQPFFTTKPTGVGTGLGLSLAYDIVTKGHGGELKVKTKVGEGAEFIISIPA